VLIGVDGFKAWAVAKELFGADVLGLPYLSIEVYQFEGNDVQLFRAGKTSEFGYLIMAPAEIGPALLKRLQDCVAQQGGGPVGVDTHDKLRLEGRFFNIYAEGAVVRDPLVLGLQWMIDFDKDTFAGYDAIMQRRSEGLKRKIIGVSMDSGVEGLRGGAGVYDKEDKVAEVVAACHSYVLDTDVGLAVFPFDLAYAGLQFNLDAADGPMVKTISMPPIMPKSLTVKLDEM
jgi:aminomethyltransferase